MLNAAQSDARNSPPWWRGIQGAVHSGATIPLAEAGVYEATMVSVRPKLLAGVHREGGEASSMQFTVLVTFCSHLVTASTSLLRHCDEASRMRPTVMLEIYRHCGEASRTQFTVVLTFRSHLVTRVTKLNLDCDESCRMRPTCLI